MICRVGSNTFYRILSENIPIAIPILICRNIELDTAKIKIWYKVINNRTTAAQNMIIEIRDLYGLHHCVYTSFLFEEYALTWRNFLDDYANEWIN